MKKPKAQFSRSLKPVKSAENPVQGHGSETHEEQEKHRSAGHNAAKFQPRSGKEPARKRAVKADLAGGGEAIETPSSKPALTAQSGEPNSPSPDAVGVEDEISKDPGDADGIAMVESILKKFSAFGDLEQAKQGIKGRRDLMISFEQWNASPGGIDDERGPHFPYPTVASEKFYAWGQAARIAGMELSDLVQTTIHAPLDVIRHNGGCGTGAVRILLSSLTSVLAEMKLLMRDPGTRELFAVEARNMPEFPALLSIFNKENLDAEKFILNELSLGRDLPFKIDPRRPCTPYNAWAMRIVLWINRERHKESSIYRKVEPSLGDFSTGNNGAWENILKFHLDYFQSPGHEQWRKLAKKHSLQTDYQPDHGATSDRYETYRQSNIDFFKMFRGPVQDLTEMPEFKVILESGRDKNAKKRQGLYNRVKHKILHAARSMVR